MSEGSELAMCPNCHAPVEVGSGWRLESCPQCSTVVLRMAEDAAYD